MHNTSRAKMLLTQCCTCMQLWLNRLLTLNRTEELQTAFIVRHRPSDSAQQSRRLWKDVKFYHSHREARMLLTQCCTRVQPWLNRLLTLNRTEELQTAFIVRHRPSESVQTLGWAWKKHLLDKKAWSKTDRLWFSASVRRHSLSLLCHVNMSK